MNGFEKLNFGIGRRIFVPCGLFQQWLPDRQQTSKIIAMQQCTTNIKKEVRS